MLYFFLSLSQSTMQSWINSSMKTISETSQPGLFFLLKKRRKLFWMVNFYVIFSTISLRNSQVPKHMPKHEKPKQCRSGSLAALEGWVPQVWWLLAPWSITTVLCTGGRLQLNAAEQFWSGHLGRPPNSLATAVTPLSLCIRAEWQGATEELCNAPQGWRALGGVWSKKSLQSDCKECKALLDSSGWMTNKWQQWSY